VQKNKLQQGWVKKSRGGLKSNSLISTPPSTKENVKITVNRKWGETHKRGRYENHLKDHERVYRRRETPTSFVFPKGNNKGKTRLQE